MSFLKISDPTKRDQTVKEYLELKKNIRDNLLSERTGEQQFQTELTKFYRPITESQKATAREITEGLKPIREGIEKLPQAMLPIGEATGEEEEEEQTEATPENLGEIAYNYLHGKEPYPRDKTFGIYLGKDGHYHMGKQINKENKKILTIAYDNIIVDGEKFRGTPGLWELVMEEKPRNYTKEDIDEYRDLLITLFIMILIQKTPTQEAVVAKKLVSICDELKRQGVLDTTAYKKLNCIIKK